jgi:acetyl-CoA synthetase
MEMIGHVPGVGDQVVRNASSFAEAHARHEWKIPERYNIAQDVVDRWADDPARSGDTALGVLTNDGVMELTTWSEVQEYSRRLGDALVTRLGIKPGDVVAVVLKQSLPGAIAHMAAYRIGAVVCPISHLYAGEGLMWRLRHSEAKVLITDVDGVDGVPIGSDLLPDLANVVVVDAGPRPDVHDFWPLLDASSGTCETAATRPDDPALLIYTSGTTGDPKGVLHGQRVALGHANVAYLFEGVRDTDVFWAPNDWSWIAGVGNGLLAPWGFGIPIFSMGDRRFDPLDVAQFVEVHHPTIGFMPPSALRLMRQSDVHLAHPFRALMSGGEVLTDEMRDWCLANLCATINVGFGQTEGNDTLGVVAAWEKPADDTVGRVLPGHFAAVLNTDGTEVPDGVEGELCMRTEGRPVFFLEYFKNPEDTARTLRDGWIHTGDHFYRGADGYFHFVGRGDDVIKSSGYRIGPTEIENIVSRHPQVIECAVIGLPDPARGQVITAVLRLRPGANTEETTRALAEQVRDNVGKHAYPRRFEIVEEFPKTVTGKIRRAAVKTLFA